MITEQHHLFDNQFTVGNSECCKMSYRSNSLKLSSSMTNNKTQCLCDSTFRVKKDMITGRRRSGKGNVFSHICLSTVGRGSVHVQGHVLGPCLQGSVPHVQGHGRSSFCTGPHPQTCSNLLKLDLTLQCSTQTWSNLFTVKLILSASRWLVFD